MDHFVTREGQLHAEDVPIATLAEKVGTPFYCYSTATLVRHYRVFADAFAEIPTLICFAVKANSNIAVLKTLAAEGSGADCVSGGEVKRARMAGIDPLKIVFSGVGKTREEMAYALSEKIGQFNAESREELALLNEVAGAMGVKAPVALRVNPDVAAKSHDKISTGRKTDKFGIPYEQAVETYRYAASLPNLQVMAMTTHIGSQLTDLAPFRDAFARIVALVPLLREAGITLRRIDLGGGLGIPYGAEGSDTPPHPEEYAKLVIAMVRDLGCQLVLEPGRLICGNAGILVSKVVLVKQTPARNFLILDAAMNDLMRPALYDSYHEIVTVSATEKDAPTQLYDVVGPVCETSDVLGKQRSLPTSLKPGDLVALRSAGAYGAVMSNVYNTRPLIPEVLVSGNQWSIIRPRLTVEEQLAREQFAAWQGK